MGKLKLVVFLGSVRDGRMGDRVIKFIQEQLEKANVFEVEIVDPAVLDLPLLNKPAHFYKPDDQSSMPQKLKDLASLVEKADAYLVVSPEYNRCVPPALVNTMDHVGPSSYKCKPSGIVTYSMGSQAGAVVGALLRPFLAELGCLPVSSACNIGTVQNQLTEHGKTENTHVVSSFSKLMIQVEWFASAMKNHKAAHGTY